MSWKYLKTKKISDARLFEVIRRPIITEKATRVAEFNQYAFEVADDATKNEVKQAVEKLFHVAVLAVNTINIDGKFKRFKGRLGKTGGIRKAIVTLKAGDVIDMTSGV